MFYIKTPKQDEEREKGNAFIIWLKFRPKVFVQIVFYITVRSRKKLQLTRIFIWGTS